MKRIIFIIAAIAVLLLFPSSALANSPVPRPGDLEILIDDCSNVKFIKIYTSQDGVNFENADVDLSEEDTRRRSEKIFSFYVDETQCDYLKIRVYFFKGKSVFSNAVEFKEYSSYIYDVESNSLEKGRITSRKANGMDIFLNAFVLIVPLLVTLIIEYVVSAFFKISPHKYVVIANLISNPMMNILILSLYNSIPVDYWFLVLIFEILFTSFEFSFYAIKYKEYSIKRLLSFCITANLVSWAIYSLISLW